MNDKKLKTLRETVVERTLNLTDVADAYLKDNPFKAGETELPSDYWYDYELVAAHNFTEATPAQVLAAHAIIDMIELRDDIEDFAVFEDEEE